jgi:hypothetical protein
MRVFHRFVIAAILYVMTPMSANPQNIPPKQTSSNVDKSAIASLNSHVQALAGSANRWNTWYLFLVFVAVLVGAATLIFQYMAVKKGRELSDAQGQLIELKDRGVAAELKDKDLKIAEAQARIREAEEQTAAATERVANAERETARLNGLAEEEHLSRVKIEEKLAHRRLSLEQQHNIASKLRPFAGQRLNFFAISGDTEILDIGNEVAAALTGPNSAGWLVTASVGQLFGETIPGIAVELMRSPDPISLNAARALVAALKDERLSVIGPIPEAFLGSAGKLNTDPEAKIKIVIGKKP